MILADRFNYPDEFHRKSKEALEIALNTARAYESWRKFDPGAGASTEERYDSLPMLTKQMMREHFPTGLAPNHRDIEKGLLNDEIEYTFTSGTTGDRVINIWDQDWWNRSEAASWGLNACLAKLAYPQREAKLASSLNVGISCEEDLPMESRTVGNTLYLNEKISIIQWMPRHYARMTLELERFRPVILEANPSLLARLAYRALDEGVELYSPKAVIFTYELPSKIHLKAIGRVFSSPLISSFGTTETGFVMEECEQGLLHQNLDFCRIDFCPLKDEYGGPELGRILVTTFDNPWNSVVRFDVGDLVRLHTTGECGCGIKHGLIAKAVEGRAANATFTTSNGLVTTMMLDEALAAITGIRDYRLQQNSKTDYHLQLMADKNARDVVKASHGALESLYGRDGRYHIEIVDRLLPGPAGKFRRTGTNFDFDVEELFA